MAFNICCGDGYSQFSPFAFMGMVDISRSVGRTTPLDEPMGALGRLGMLLRGLRAWRADEGTGHDDDDVNDEWSTGQRGWFPETEEGFDGVAGGEFFAAESEDQNQPMLVANVGCWLDTWSRKFRSYPARSAPHNFFSGTNNCIGVENLIS